MIARLRDLLLHWLGPMRRREPTRVCPTLAELTPPVRDMGKISLAMFKRIKLGSRG
jgi:hypothetical protein